MPVYVTSLEPSLITLLSGASILNVTVSSVEAAPMTTAPGGISLNGAEKVPSEEPSVREITRISDALSWT